MGVWGKAQPMKSNMFSNLAMNYATNICINGFINWNKLHGINLIVVGQASKDWNIFGPNCPGLVVVGYVFRVCPRENHTGKSSRNGQCSSIFHTKLFKWPGDITDKWAMDSSVFQVYPCLSLCKVVCFSRGNVAKSQRGQPWGLNSGPVMLHPTLFRIRVLFF